MKTKFTLSLLALSLAGCQTYPQDPGYPGPGYPPPAYPSEATYRGIGTEPFWDLEIGRDMVFTDRGNNNFRVVQPTPRPINGVAGEIYQTQRLNVNIVHSRCSDGMSDRNYPDTVQVRVDGREFRGCGAPIAFDSQIGENGLPNAPGDATVAFSQTNWRVVSVNGRPTPQGSYYMNFQPDRIAARLGCNSLGAGYTQAGSMLTTGAIMATRMSCPDMSFEDAGSRVLSRPMTVSGLGDRVTLSNALGSIELVRAR